MCPINSISLEENVPYMISVGSDQSIRYWNFLKSHVKQKAVQGSESYLISTQTSSLTKVNYYSNFIGMTMVVTEKRVQDKLSKIVINTSKLQSSYS